MRAARGAVEWLHEGEVEQAFPEMTILSQGTKMLADQLHASEIGCSEEAEDSQYGLVGE